MSEPGRADPLEVIRDVFSAYKMLPALGTKSYLDIVVKQLDKVFGQPDDLESPEVNKSQALKTIGNVFKAFKKLNKWDPKAASEILVEHLERVLASNAEHAKETNEKPGQINKDDNLQFAEPQEPQVVPTATVPIAPCSEHLLTSPGAHEAPSSCSSPSASSAQSTVGGVSGQRNGRLTFFTPVKFKRASRKIGSSSRSKSLFKKVSHKTSYLGRKLQRLIKQAKSGNNNINSSSSSLTRPDDDPSQDAVNDDQIQGHPRRTIVAGHGQGHDHPLEGWGVVNVETRPASLMSKSRTAKRSRKGILRPRAVCPFCSKAMRADYLPHHVRVHTGEKPFSCQFCDNQYTTKAALTLHLRARERRFPCRLDSCCHSFNLERMRNHHEQLNHAGNIVIQQEQHPLVNNIDDFKDPDLPVLEIEGSYSYSTPPKKSREGKRNPARCEICNYRFSNRVLLGSHMRKEHADPLDRPYLCQFCGERFKKEIHHRNHVSLRHTRTGLYDCTECSCKFTSLKQLERHCVSKHLDFLYCV